MHWGLAPQNTHPNFTHHPQTLCPIHDPNAMEIDALNLSLVKRSCCLRNCLCFICKQPNCSTRNHPCEETPAGPMCNPERTRMTTTTPVTATPNESNLGKYVKELEGKGRKPNELLWLLQLAVEADEKTKCLFRTGSHHNVPFLSHCLCTCSESIWMSNPIPYSPKTWSKNHCNNCPRQLWGNWKLYQSISCQLSPSSLVNNATPPSPECWWYPE